MADTVNAHPTKTFFLEMFTRDITLEDAILDLIDNAVDALCRSRNIDLSVYYSKGNGTPHPPPIENQHGFSPAEIHVSYSNDTFRIRDNCGGIPYQNAKDEVFRFGRIRESTNIGLSEIGRASCRERVCQYV
jgi:hypothetical protein